MSKKQKQLQATIPGIGARVVDNDLNYAIRMWKSKLKDSEKLIELDERQQFTKKSVKRRQEVIKARYKQLINSKRDLLS